MSSPVILSGLSWLTPEGSTLFTDLNLTFGPERTGLVGRNGSGKSTLLRLIAGALRPAAGQVLVAGTLAVMRQDAVQQPDDTIADLFGIGPALEVLARAEAGLADASELAEVDWSLPARVDAALLRLGLSADPQAPLTKLSGGQRSRAALAALAFQQPDILLLDEPTNNLDRNGRAAVIDLLRAWSGAAIVASHDRALLEEMDAIVELTSLKASRYGGNYSAYRQRKAAELDAAVHDLAHAARAGTEAARRARIAAERKARKDGAGHRARAKGGQPKILLDAAKGRAEASGGAGVRLRDARREAADEAQAAAREKIEILQPLRMELPSTNLARGKTVLRLDKVTGGYDPARPIIRDLTLAIEGPARLVISGANGSGKSTLLKMITGQITPQSGRASLEVPWALLDQHLGLLQSGDSLRENFLRLNPACDPHLAHEALARFGFRAVDALRHAGDLSGGERLRAGLACALGAKPPPMLLILDEPTNHLDLDGIAALEAALAAYRRRLADGPAGRAGADGAVRGRAGAQRHSQGRLGPLPSVAGLQDRHRGADRGAGRQGAADDPDAGRRVPVGEPQGLGHVPVRDHDLRAGSDAAVGWDRRRGLRDGLPAGDLGLGMAGDDHPAVAFQPAAASGLQPDHGGTAGRVDVSAADLTLLLCAKRTAPTDFAARSINVRSGRGTLFHAGCSGQSVGSKSMDMVCPSAHRPRLGFG
jgi:ATPase subunit of ABC transporter with duplicated ATPase domains